MQRILGAKSVNLTHLLYINKDDFMLILKDFPKDMVKFVYLINELL